MRKRVHSNKLVGRDDQDNIERILWWLTFLNRLTLQWCLNFVFMLEMAVFLVLQKGKSVGFYKVNSRFDRPRCVVFNKIIVLCVRK